MKHASLITLGCKVNSFDTAVLWEGLEKKGYNVSGKLEAADLYVINTCTVTNSANAQSRKLIRKVKKLSPDSIVVVTGCYAQVSPEEISRIEGVDYLIGNGEKDRLLEIIDKANPAREQRVEVGDIFDHASISVSRLDGFKGKRRAFLKVQDGCEAFCTYCIIPYARGKSRSLSLEKVEAQARAMAASGFKEIVLTGIHLGGYGLDLEHDPEKRTNLLSLLNRLDQIDADIRFRISSIEPTEIDDEMLEFLVSSEKICRHLHIPLQSGDDMILERMGRRYDGAYYRSRIEKICSSWDGVAIGIDIMAGFPGEDSASFLRSYDLVKSLPASYLHVFPYSKRDGTPAVKMDGHVEPLTLKKRCASLRQLGDAMKEAFCRSQAGRRLNALKIEVKDGHVKTLSDNYIEVMIPSESWQEALFADVRLTEIKGKVCFGELF
ncbi:MAG: tRNA (N(6)-L-threonylcarbamoyladenosine(37)-C(2))-methylthiotransferase MtaB [bacterium]|nr:tRNA (N(6)-L-threonylcarbamoyladenosine(37)-C(2))-methylthiotransferase MtaB [bacterium]